MNKKTKYFVVLKYTFLSLILSLVLGIVNRFLGSLNNQYKYILSPIQDVISTVKVILVIVLIMGISYLLYLVVLYYSSKFYRDYQIQVFEAIYHGFADIHLVYDRIKMSPIAKDITVDFKRSTIVFHTSKGNYSIKYLDLFGKIEGKQDSEFWTSVSKPKKKYNQKVYSKQIRFSNPFRSNQEYVDELEQKTDFKYKNYVVISGFYNMKYKSEFVISPYEMIDFI